VKLPCPGCGFLTIDSDYYGSYDICSICDWEDDGVQLANPCSGGGANGDSLAVHQKTWVLRLPLPIRSHEGISRSEKWRPLTDTEIQTYESQQQEQHWTNTAILDEEETYWSND
jgi:Cysteine-rich CPCC